MNNANAVRQAADNEETESEVEARMHLEETIQVFGSGLDALFGKNVGLKEELEQRYLDDLRHYNGKYDRETKAKMSSSSGATGSDKRNQSKIFVNLTRSKTNTAESKWADLILPTDDRNWGIKPTPVPELVSDLESDDKVMLDDGSTATDPETEEPYQKKDIAKEIIEQAKKACELMQTEINDQLTEARYNAVCREIIHDAVTLGIGIIKGPMVERQSKTAWIEGKNGEWERKANGGFKPTAVRVDPWNFFPDMSAINWEDTEYVFERHLLTRKQLRKLAKQPGFMPDQIRKVLMGMPNARASKLNYLNELREINGITQVQNDNRYEVLEYHGPIDKNNLLACGCKGIDEADPMEEYDGTVWLSMGIVIKVSLNHMDSEELPYSLLNWEKDETSIFGFGVPYRMRAPQRVINASWRMVLDNAGLSTGPQILINKELVEPQDGIWTLTPRKVWWITSSDTKIRAQDVMQTFTIDSHQSELTAIFEMAHRLADEETSVPQMQMGNQPGDTQQPAMLKTLGGTQLWMSSNNIMMRKAVKNFDDDITAPFITRFYDWNMQFSEKAEIKGDYFVDARGTSVLLVREMQARNIAEFVNIAMSLPGGDEEIKARGILKNTAKGMQISADDILRSDEDVKVAEEEAKNNPPPQDPEQMKIEAQAKLKQMEIEAKAVAADKEAQLKMTILESERQVALINREVELTKIASVEGVNLEKIRSESKIKKYQTDFNIRKFYTEINILEKNGPGSNIGLSNE